MSSSRRSQTSEDEEAVPQQTAAPTDDPRMVNAGTYEMSVDAFAIGFNWHI